MMETFVPMHDNVLVKRGDPASVSKGGIIIPDTAKEKTRYGEVLAVGKGRWADGKFIETAIKVGTKVYFSAYGGHEIQLGPDSYLLLSEKEILGYVK